jgi:hypothetical protein
VKKKQRRAAEKRGWEPHLAYRWKRPITWWRHSVFEKITGDDLVRFHRALEAGSVGVLPPDLIRRALHDGDLALRAALDLHPGTALPGDELVDLAISWAMLAVSLGNKVAALLVAEAMRQHMERFDAHPWRQAPEAADIARMRLRMHTWFGLSPINNLFLATRDGSGLLGPTIGNVGANSSFSLVPVQSIPGGGRWGKEIATRYEGLTKPLSLKMPRLHPDHLEMKLYEEMPNFAAATAAVADDLRLQSAGELPITRFRPLLLLGKPGIGKTRYARRLASLLGVPVRMIAAAGTQTPDVTGLTRVYDSTQAGVVARTMMETSVANPLILVDEIDKANALGREARLQDALLAMIDSESASRVPDECLSTTVDLSCVSWILTANDVTGLSSPLLDRVRAFYILPPDAEHLPTIIQMILQDVATDFRVLPDAMPELPPETIQKFLAAYRDGASIRAIKRAVIAAVSVSMRPVPHH